MNFKFKSTGKLNQEFLKREISDFYAAMKHIKNLPYGRNSNRTDFLLVLSESKGTCSSKHALLKSLAEENFQTEVKLMLGIFKMNGNNTPKIKNTLDKFGLEYIPEAHNYLRIQGSIYDCTTENYSEINFENDLLNEMEIQPEDVIHKKIEIHQEFLKNWCQENELDFQEIWEIRENCISALSGI